MGRKILQKMNRTSVNFRTTSGQLILRVPISVKLIILRHDWISKMHISR